MPHDSVILRFGLAGLTVAAAAWLRILLDPVLGDRFPFVTLFPAVVVTALYGGVRPGLASVALGVPAAWWLLPPRGGFPVEGVGDAALFALPGAVVAVVCGRMGESGEQAPSAARDPDGKKQVELALAHEVEQLSRSQKALAEQTAVLRSMMDSMGDGVVVADTAGTFNLFNPAAERILGRGGTSGSPTEWAEKYRCFELDRTTPFAYERLPLVRALRGESCDGLLLYIKYSDADGAVVSFTGRPLRTPAGDVTGGVVVFRDVTEQRRAEVAVRESEERLRRVLTESPFPMALHTEEGELLYVSDSFSAIAGGRGDQVRTIADWTNLAGRTPSEAGIESA